MAEATTVSRKRSRDEQHSSNRDGSLEMENNRLGETNAGAPGQEGTIGVPRREATPGTNVPSSPHPAGNTLPADEGTRRSSSSACCRVRKGMVILKSFLPAEEQAQLAAHVHRLGALQHGGFFSCHNEKTRRMRMMNLGLRTDGSRHVLDIPRAWTDVASRACRLAAEIDPSIPVLRPDICVVNHYSVASRLGWHQDLFSSRDPGLPVVSLSLGQSATFQYRVSWKKTAGVKSVTLESGDALIFGGRSRGIIHGVPGIGNAAVVASTPAAAVSAVGARAKEGAPAGEEPYSPFAVPDGGRYNLNFREL